MADIFYPGCRVKSGLPEASEKLAEYMKNRHGMDAVGCCKQDGGLLGPEDHAVLICNNCAKDLKTSQEYAGIRFVYELIDADEEFHFPDYKGMELPLQDCGHGYAGHDMEGTVRSLLRKMNVRYRELPGKVVDGMSFPEHMKTCEDNIPMLETSGDNGPKPEVCGDNSPKPEACGENITGQTARDVLVYCNICRKAYMDRGCRVVHLLDLLMETDQIS